MALRRKGRSWHIPCSPQSNGSVSYTVGGNYSLTGGCSGGNSEGDIDSDDTQILGLTTEERLLEMDADA